MDAGQAEWRGDTKTVAGTDDLLATAASRFPGSIDADR